MSNRKLRKREKGAQAHKWVIKHFTGNTALSIKLTRRSIVDVAPHNTPSTSSSSPHLSMNFSKLKKAYREHVVPELKEEDLEESFVRGKIFRMLMTFVV